MSVKSKWIVLAIASGCCAAVNGAFAKLTTASTTTALSAALLSPFNLSQKTLSFFTLVLRVCFFLLNLAFNALMWTLFTWALTSSSSTTRVSVVNTSANFLITGVLGALVFGESISWKWLLGAACMAGGCVVIGRRDEDKVPQGSREDGTETEVLLQDDQDSAIELRTRGTQVAKDAEHDELMHK